MPPGSGTRLVGLCLAAAALVAFIAVAGASAATARTVALRITFAGSGQLWVTGALKSGRYNCTSTSSPCAVTFHVPRGRRIVLHEQPANGWHLTGGWNAACHGSLAVTRDRVPPEQSCPLRLKARRSANLTFVPPYPGEFLNPWPLGTTITLYSALGPTFAVTVNSATINANAEVEAVTDPHTGNPPTGRRRRATSTPLSTSPSLTRLIGGRGLPPSPTSLTMESGPRERTAPCTSPIPACRRRSTSAR
jgi:hypothetical protein